MVEMAGTDDDTDISVVLVLCCPDDLLHHVCIAFVVCGFDEGEIYTAVEHDDSRVVDDDRCRELGDDVGPKLRSLNDKIAGEEDQNEVDDDHGGDLPPLDGSAFETGTNQDGEEDG